MRPAHKVLEQVWLNVLFLKVILPVDNQDNVSPGNSCIRREILVPIKDALWYKEMIASIGRLTSIQQFSVVLDYKKHCWLLMVDLVG